jgi:hypothetical protein
MTKLTDLKCYLAAVGLDTPDTKLITGRDKDHLEGRLKSEYRRRVKKKEKTFKDWKRDMLAEKKLAYYLLYTIDTPSGPSVKYKRVCPEEVV